MIRAIMLFSVVVVSLLSTACQKEQKRPTPAQVAPNQYRGMIPGAPGAPGAPIVPGAPGVSGNNGGLSLDNGNNNTSTQTPSHVARSQRDDGTLVDDSGTPAAAGSVPALAPSEAEVPDPSAAAPPLTAAAPPQAAPPPAAAPAPDLSAQAAAPPAQQTSQAAPPPADGGTSVVESSAPVKAPVPSTLSATLTPPVHADDPQWLPGLAREPLATPKVTHNGRSDGAIYTDSNNDDLMEKNWAAFNAKKELVTPNTNLAKTINGVQLTSPDGKSYRLEVDIFENNSQIQLIFSGKRFTGAEKEAAIEAKAKAGKNKTAAQLPSKLAASQEPLRSFYLKLDSKQSVPQGLTYRYSAHVLCSDDNVESCQSASIEIGKFDLSAKDQKAPLAKAFIVHRLGSAIVTFDRSRSQSSQVTAFTQILADMATNVCISEKAQSTGDSLASLTKVCPSNDKLATGFSDVWMRTWAVAGGGARYEVILAAGEDKSDVSFSQSLIFTGELVVPSQKTPEKVAVIDHSGHNRETPFRDKSIELKNADGNGALNFNLVFLDDGTQRISVTSNFAKTRVPEVKISDATLTRKH